MIDLSALEARHGTAEVLRAAHEYIKSHRKEKSALLKIERGKAHKGSVRKSTYLKTRRECDAAFSRMVKRQRGNTCQLHKDALERNVKLPVKCGGGIQLFHIISKSECESLRYDEHNVILACAGANRHEGFHRSEWREIFDQLYPETMKLLRERMKWPRVKRNEAMLRQMAEEFSRA